VLRITNRAREQFFNQALEMAAAKLAQVRDRPGYGKTLLALANEALAHMDGETVLHADPRDQPWFLTLEPQRRVEFDLQTWGGLEARTLDGRIVVVNTLEARLECAREMLRREIIPLVDQPVEQWANTTMPTQGCAR
jgi:vacuolar-type H+-ATPase subunit E/Vma4